MSLPKVAEFDAFIHVIDSDLEKLQSALRDCADQYKGYTDPESSMASMFDSLFHINEFLQKKGFGLKEIMPLAMLRASVEDLLDGRETLLRRAQNSPGRPQISNVRLYVLATLSLAMSLLMETGFSEDDAALKISELCRTYNLDEEIRTEKQFKKWRDDMSRGVDKKSKDARDYHERLKKVALESCGGDKQKILRQLLDDMIPAMGNKTT